MLSGAIIVFREVLEAALVVGIVYAASRGVRGRHRWIWGGFLAGILGAALVAVFAGEIADALEGMGQEFFNASVLLLAVTMLGWHIIWMGRHGRELAATVRRIGDSVREGSVPLHALTVVVALAILREGSEIVLFMHGLLAGGAAGLFAGSLIGLAAGGAVGLGLYFGLVKIPQRYLFGTTSLLILLLSAGLASQAAVYLVQANVLPTLGGPLWDTSAVLREDSLFGETLKVLIGYDDKPMGIQLVFYLVTLGAIGGAAMVLRTPRAVPAQAHGVGLGLCALGGVLLMSPVDARADHKVYSPIVEQGETEFEFRIHNKFDDDDSIDGAQAMKLTAGYGLTSRWFSEVVLEWEDEPGESTELEAIEWENIFQLTEQGRYWADWGLLAEYVDTQHGENDKLELGLLMGKSMSNTLLNVNLIMEREIGSGAEKSIEMEYGWEFRWRLDRRFEPGIQAYGDLGELDDIEFDGEHLLGPAVFGSVYLNQTKFNYDFAFLFGLNKHAPDALARMQVEIEF